MGCHRATLWRDQSDPPWKSSLTGMCECLSVGGALPALDRRKAEDALANAVYREVPAPERELLALVHTHGRPRAGGRRRSRQPHASRSIAVTEGVSRRVARLHARRARSHGHLVGFFYP